MFQAHHPIVVLVTVVCAVAALPAAGAVIPLTNDSTQTAGPSFGTTKAGPLNDPFAYDPNDPTAALPVSSYPGNAAQLWHSTDGDLTTQYAVLFDQVYSDIFVDFYARTDDPGAYNRDDNLQFRFYNGGWAIGNLIYTETPVTIDNSGTGHNRITILNSVEVDRLAIYNDSSTNWSIAELRGNGIPINGIPEPASAVLVAAGGLVLLSRRRQARRCLTRSA